MNDAEKYIELKALEVAAAQVLSPQLLANLSPNVRETLYGELAYTLHTFVFGQEGERTTVRTYHEEPRFPRWLPKWLRERWTRTVIEHHDVTPQVIYPEMLDVPRLGEGRRSILFHPAWEDE